MKGDFTRDTFDPAKHFSRVLLQQGRVQLDADFNERAALLLGYLRALATDLIGPHGGPDNGFKISRIPMEARRPLTDLRIGAGRYYVNGLLCENQREVEENDSDGGVTYFAQPNFPISKEIAPLPRPPFLSYLDVWERHIGCIEEEEIREPALGGPDTSTRSRTQVVWQVKLLSLKTPTPNKSRTSRSAAKAATTGVSLTKLWREKAESALRPLASSSKALLRARARSMNNANASKSKARGNYRGSEDRLYRVEIHEGGPATPTFKWSRDNVSVAGRSAGRSGSLSAGDWVEVVNNDYSHLSQRKPLLQLRKSDMSKDVIRLAGTSSAKLSSPSKEHLLLRRWEGWQEIPRETGKGSKWIELEDGVQIQFASPSGTYRTGDYWMIPARVETAGVEWPRGWDNNAEDGLNDEQGSISAAMPPASVKHCYAPLAVLTSDAKGNIIPIDLRRVFRHFAAD